MDIDDQIKLNKERCAFPASTRTLDTLYCYRCGQTVFVYQPTSEDLRRDPTLDDYIGDRYCSNCMKEITGELR